MLMDYVFIVLELQVIEGCCWVLKMEGEGEVWRVENVEIDE